MTFRRAFQCDVSNKNKIGKLQTGYWRYWWVLSCESTVHSRIWVVKVETRFFDDGYDGRQFESQRVRARAERDVNDVSDKWTDDREIVLNEFGWYGIQSAGGDFYLKPLHVF